MKTQKMLDVVIDLKKFAKFYIWWDEVGSSITPKKGEDAETHAQRVAKEAFIIGRDSAA